MGRLRSALPGRPAEEVGPSWRRGDDHEWLFKTPAGEPDDQRGARGAPKLAAVFFGVYSRTCPRSRFSPAPTCELTDVLIYLYTSRLACLQTSIFTWLHVHVFDNSSMYVQIYVQVNRLTYLHILVLVHRSTYIYIYRYIAYTYARVLYTYRFC